MENRNKSAMTIGQVAQQQFNPNLREDTFNLETSPQTQLPEEGRNGTFIKNFGRFERAGATYHWKIFRAGREKLIGYSKPLNMAEKANKQELLLDCVRRLVRNGYIKEGMRIEFYRAFHESDDDQSVKIFTMYGTRYIPEPVILTESWLIAFLKNVYSPPVSYYNPSAGLFPTGGKNEPPANTAIIPDPAHQLSAKDPFDLGRSFKNEDALMNYMQKLLDNGEPRGRVEEYYRIKIQAFHSRT
ncbi:hypothetical protein [Spirosoma sp.]|uniref:hypothetical protein n=1 Tax=Spirosoma sp. TaxID=1899569 RepID=UPI00260F7A9C|nr:hypothetical protein [Spirosoma sp.]MCX6216372.1 hypothetical protein [Spirosoma sp.]